MGVISRLELGHVAARGLFIIVTVEDYGLAVACAMATRRPKIQSANFQGRSAPPKQIATAAYLTSLPQGPNFDNLANDQNLDASGLSMFLKVSSHGPGTLGAGILYMGESGLLRSRDS